MHGKTEQWNRKQHQKYTEIYRGSENMEKRKILPISKDYSINITEQMINHPYKNKAGTIWIKNKISITYMGHKLILHGSRKP